jgi:hypothetical protein
MAGGGGDNGLLLWNVGVTGPFTIPFPFAGLRFDAPWELDTTSGKDINDAGDVLFFASNNPAVLAFWGTKTGYGILQPDGTILPDSTGTMLADWGPISTQLSNTKGQFIGSVPDAILPPGELDWALFTPAPVPEPSSLFLLGTLAVPVLIRLRMKQR